LLKAKEGRLQEALKQRKKAKKAAANGGGSELCIFVLLIAALFSIKSYSGHTQYQAIPLIMAAAAMWRLLRMKMLVSGTENRP